MLDFEDFKNLVKNAPLFAIDLVVLNERNQILIGQRKNAPAKGFWFVPGGRVFKDETQAQAVQRISQAELGCELTRDQLGLLGIFDHFYDDSCFDNEISTHYINATHLVRLETHRLNFPKDQHTDYRWVTLETLVADDSIHTYSKIFLPTLKQWLNQ